MDEQHFELIASIPSQCTLGEGAVWDSRAQSLWFTDIQERQLLRLDWPSRELARYDLAERLGSLGLTADPGRLVCAFASGFALYKPESGELRWLFQTEPEYRGVRMNDGRIDRQGRFWAGSMVEREEGAPPERGSLWRVDHANRSTPVVQRSGITISNAICFAPSGERMYFADTPTQQIMAFDLDPLTGKIGEGEVFAQLSGKAYPDGADVDAGGRVWNAEWGSGRVTAYHPDGTMFAQLDLPVTQATCVAFGGPELDLLFVTTAREGLGREKLEQEPDAGNVLVYRTSNKGLAAQIFSG